MKILDLDLEPITINGDCIALVAGCRCEAGDPGDCHCPDATWFIRHCPDDWWDR